MRGNKRTIISKREVEVLQLLADGCTAKEIGLILNISEHTVKNHRDSINIKLRGNNITHSVSKAYKQGLLDRGQ